MGAVKGVVAGEFGKNADGTPGDAYEPGMELHGKYVFLSEGVRGSLAKEVIGKFDLDADSDPQKFGIGMKEIWEIDPAKHKEGRVLHTMGWPLGTKNTGGSFIYHLDNNQVYVGSDRRSELQEPISFSLYGIPAAQASPDDCRPAQRRQTRRLWRRVP